MSAPLTISKDDLREEVNFNYSAIDQYWQDQGYTEDILRSQYTILVFGNSFQSFYVSKWLEVAFLNLFCGLALYLASWLSRKKINALKLLGDKSMNRWETFCQGFKLGQAPAINFVSSCLITNDRVFITLRVILAVWSLVITIYTWAGNRSIFFGSYYPLATIITIYVSRQRNWVQIRPSYKIFCTQEYTGLNLKKTFDCWRIWLKDAVSQQAFAMALLASSKFCRN